MRNANILAIVLLVAGLGAGFFAGMQYQQNKVGQAVVQNQRGFMGQGRNGFVSRNGIRPVAGEIISADDKSITVKLADGSSKIVLLSGTTQVSKAEAAVKNDLKAGEKVAVFGSQNSDGSITAQNIQLNPQLRGAGSTPSAFLK